MVKPNATSKQFLTWYGQDFTIRDFHKIYGVTMSNIKLMFTMHYYIHQQMSNQTLNGMVYDEVFMTYVYGDAVYIPYILNLQNLMLEHNRVTSWELQIQIQLLNGGILKILMRSNIAQVQNLMNTLHIYQMENYHLVLYSCRANKWNPTTQINIPSTFKNIPFYQIHLYKWISSYHPKVDHWALTATFVNTMRCHTSKQYYEIIWSGNPTYNSQK